MLRLLRRQPEHNIYLLGQVARGGLMRTESGAPMLGYFHHGLLEGVMSLGPNLVLSAPISPAGVAAFADRASEMALHPRVAVGHDRHLDHFMTAYGRDPDQIRMERPDQILFRVRPGTLAGDAREPGLRPGRVTELDAIVVADRAMVAEELGFDPFLGDLASYRAGWRRRIQEERAWVVGEPGGPPVFKVELSAVCDDGIQLSGVYTTPSHRRRGVAYRAVGELCQRLHAKVPVVTLYVHELNVGAVRLYEALGFERVGRVRSVWFEGS